MENISKLTPWIPAIRLKGDFVPRNIAEPLPVHGLYMEVEKISTIHWGRGLRNSKSKSIGPASTCWEATTEELKYALRVGVCKSVNNRWIWLSTLFQWYILIKFAINGRRQPFLPWPPHKVFRILLVENNISYIRDNNDLKTIEKKNLNAIVGYCFKQEISPTIQQKLSIVLRYPMVLKQRHSRCTNLQRAPGATFNKHTRTWKIHIHI